MKQCMVPCGLPPPGGKFRFLGFSPPLLRHPRNRAIQCIAFYPFLPIPIDNDRTLEMRGWRHVGRELGKVYQKTFPQARRVYLLTDEYQLAGAISFYTPQHPVPYTFAKSQRNFWITLPELEKAGALLVCLAQTCPQDREKTRGLFKQVEPVAEIPLFRQGKMVKCFKVYYCSND